MKLPKMTPLGKFNGTKTLSPFAEVPMFDCVRDIGYCWMHCVANIVKTQMRGLTGEYR